MDIISQDELNRVNWIAAGRILGFCNKLSKSVNTEQDKKALQIEIMVLRERAYSLLEMTPAFYYGNRLNNLNDAAARARTELTQIQEKDIYALWNLIQYPDNANEHYPDSVFSETELRKLPRNGVREYIQHRKNNPVTL